MNRYRSIFSLSICHLQFFVCGIDSTGSRKHNTSQVWMVALAAIWTSFIVYMGFWRQYGHCLDVCFDNNLLSLWIVSSYPFGNRFNGCWAAIWASFGWLIGNNLDIVWMVVLALGRWVYSMHKWTEKRDGGYVVMSEDSLFTKDKRQRQCIDPMNMMGYDTLQLSNRGK